jgi:predicted PurR-regulated permease PerM
VVPGASTRFPGEGAERALISLAVAAGVALLWAGRTLLVPTALGLVLAATASPLVGWLEARKVPRWLAATIATLVASAAVAAVAILLYQSISSLWEELPTYQERLQDLWGNARRHVLRIQEQSEQLAAPRRPGQVRVQESLPWGSVLLGTAAGVTTLLGEVAVVVFLVYFGLAEGPRWVEKIMVQAGAKRDQVVEALSELRRDVAQYMLNRVILNAILGVVTAVIFAVYGLEHAAVWGLTTGLLHLVPYIGPALGLVLPTGMAVLQWGTPGRVLGVAAIYLVLVSLQGNVVDPIFLGRQLRLSALVVFLGSLIWFLLWGPIGLFLAVPLLSTVRVVCKYTTRFRSVADFLAE